MKCKTLHRKLIFFLEGDLPSHEMEQVKKHLTECPSCASFADDLRKTLSVLQSERSPEINPFFYTRLKARMENQSITPIQSKTSKVWVKFLQPTFFTILLLAGIYTGFKLAQQGTIKRDSLSYYDENIIPYLNEMQAEPIESFLME